MATTSLVRLLISLVLLLTLALTSVWGWALPA